MTCTASASSLCGPPVGTYHKERANFSDASAAVRRQLWAEAALSPSPRDTESEKVPRELFNRLADLAYYPA
jgi:hypothetical protein